MPSFRGVLATMKFMQTLIKRCIAFLHFRLLDHENTEELSIRLIDEKVINRKLLRGGEAWTLAEPSSINVTEGYTSGLKGHSLKARTTSAHSRLSKLRGFFLISTLSSTGSFLSVNFGRMFLAPGPSKLRVKNIMISK